MKSERIYEAWRQSRRQIEVRDEFMDTVMNRVYQCERKRRKSVLDMRALAELVSEHWLTKAGLVAAGAAVGLIRAAFVICAFLRA